MPAAEARVTLIGSAARAPDLVIMGSHDVALDVVVGALAERGFSARTIAVGSLGGVAAAERGECDIAPVHLIDPATGDYNTHLLAPGLVAGDGLAAHAGRRVSPRRRALRGHAAPPRRSRPRSPTRNCLMVNRNAGAGTRVLIDKLLGGARPPGYANQPRSHNAVAAAVAQGRADWGVAIEPVAQALRPRRSCRSRPSTTISCWSRAGASGRRCRPFWPRCAMRRCAQQIRALGMRPARCLS